MDAKRRLGRGLDSLLAPTQLSDEAASPHPAAERMVADVAADETERVAEIGLDRIDPNPNQPRRTWDERALLELADSIRTNGLIQPVILRPAGARYQLIAGERRLRAARLAGRVAVPAIVRQASDEQALEWALIENVHRADLNPIERAQAYRHYLRTFSLTQDEAARRLGEDRATLANYVRLLELDEEMQNAVANGRLSMGHARALLGVRELAQRHALAAKAMLDRLSVRDIEREVQALLARLPAKPAPAPVNANVRDLEQELTRALGTKVIIQTTGRKGQRGRIIIEFYSLDDFDRIRERLQA